MPNHILLHPDKSRREPSGATGVQAGPGSGLVAGVVVCQPVAGVLAVDEAEVGGGLVETEEFLQALRELADLRMAGAEGVGLAGAQPGLDVVDDHPEPRSGGGVGAGAVVEAAGEQQDRSGGHFCRDGLGCIWLAGRAEVATGDDAGGAVAGGEVVECPQCGDHDVAVAGKRGDALLVVEGLGLLAGMELNGDGVAELRAGADRLPDRIQDERVQCGLVHAACHGERGPGPLGSRAVEAGAPPGGIQQCAELCLGRGEGLPAEQPGDDCIAAALELPRDFACGRHAGHYRRGCRAGIASSKISTVWVVRTSGISCSLVSTTSRSEAASRARTRSMMSCAPETSAAWSTSGMPSSWPRTDFQDRWAMSR